MKEKVVIKNSEIDMNKESIGEKKKIPLQERTVFGVTVNIIIFGFVSLFTDLSSDMVNTVLPLFLLSIGANTTIIGVITGVSEATGNILKGVSGWISDKIKNRKSLVIGGYAISNLSKPLIGLFPSWEYTLLFKFTDRIGKGLRTSSRDAIISDSQVKKEKVGVAFGIHRALDTTGAILGPLTAFLLIAYLSTIFTNEVLIYQYVIGLSLIPGIIAIIFVILAKDIKREKEKLKQIKDYQESQIITKNFIFLIIILAITEFASIDMAFFIVRSQDFIPQIFIPLIVMLSNISYVIFSIIGGKLSDKIGRKIVILSGLGTLLICAILLAFSYPPSMAPILTPIIILIFILFGLYHGFVDPVSRALVSDIAGKNKKGRAYGLYYLTIGLITLPESIIFGFLYDNFGPTFAFSFSSIFLAICMVLFALKKFK